EVGNKLTTAERDNLAFGSILMTYECGMRFLTDHLNGDVYFKVHHDGHNLDRARTQIKMVEDMEHALPKMNEIVKKYC
ncbi:MAG: mucin desulfatase, partial [Clostridia bacterium]